jgi:hypothetical protein
MPSPKPPRPRTAKPAPRSAKSAPRSDSSTSASDQIDSLIREMPDWRGEAVTRFRAVIRHAAPRVVEEIKWRKPSNPDGSPVWSQDGILCLLNVWDDHVRLTFGNGALLPDPKRLFNAALNGNYMRGYDLREGDSVNESALHDLVKAAAAFNAKAKEAAKR